LAAAGRPDERRDLVGLDLQGDIVQRPVGGVVEAQSRDVDLGRARRRRCRGESWAYGGGGLQHGLSHRIANRRSRWFLHSKFGRQLSGYRLQTAVYGLLASGFSACEDADHRLSGGSAVLSDDSGNSAT